MAPSRSTLQKQSLGLPARRDHKQLERPVYSSGTRQSPPLNEGQKEKFERGLRRGTDKCRSTLLREMSCPLGRPRRIESVKEYG